MKKTCKNCIHWDTTEAIPNGKNDPNVPVFGTCSQGYSNEEESMPNANVTRIDYSCHTDHSRKGYFNPHYLLNESS